MRIGKVVLITGCSTGFGFLTAKLLSESSYTVYAGVRKQKDLAVFGSQTPSSKLKTILLDVTWSKEKISIVIKNIVKEAGAIDVLVNNAGVGFLGAVESFSDQEVKDQFETNFFGTLRVTKAVLAIMHQQKSGLIINVSSVSGLVTTAYYGIYSASKFALEALTTSLRSEESLFGINVVAVNPGSFQTQFWENEKFPVSNDSPLSGFNLKIKKLIFSQYHRRGDPIKVANAIKQIIETPNPRKNYLVGLDAHLLFIAAKILPYSIQDWIIKKVVKKLAQAV